jgi:hypothetical protein
VEAGTDKSADLPLGEPVDWSPVAAPAGEVLRGERVLLRPFDPAADAPSLHAATKDDPALWAYLPTGPFETAEDLRAVLEQEAAAAGTIEIGSIWFAPALRRTAAATEAIYLLARHVFDDLGYRRLEWKCNALNAASRRAAERFGFCFEGVFRKHQVVKGRNRDTAWFAITDDEWPATRAAFEAWLDPGNFDADGTQRRALVELMAAR